MHNLAYLEQMYNLLIYHSPKANVLYVKLDDTYGEQIKTDVDILD